MSGWKRLTAVLTSLRNDGWVSTMTGLGGARDPLRAHVFQGANPLSDQQLEDLYECDDIAGRIVDAVPERMLGAGFDLLVDNRKAIGDLADELARLDVRTNFELALKWARLYGGAGIFVGADDGIDPALPLSVDNIRSIKFLAVYDKTELFVQELYGDPLSSDFGKHALYRLHPRSGKGGANARMIHASRVIPFFGIPVPHSRVSTVQYWGNSVLRRCYDELQQFEVAWGSTVVAMSKVGQAIYKLKGFQRILEGGSEDTIQDRIAAVDQMRSALNALILDADGEEFELLEPKLNEMANLLDRAMYRVAGAAGIPGSILFRQTPGGFAGGGNSDADIRLWYDEVANYRTQILTPALQKMMRFIFGAQQGPTQGVEPETWTISYPPLWQPTLTETVASHQIQAQIDSTYIQAGVLSPKDVQASRFTTDGWSYETTVTELPEPPEMKSTEPPDGVVSAPNSSRVPEVEEQTGADHLQA